MVVSGVAEHAHLSWLAGASGLLGMLVAIGLWWIYLHLPIAMGITAVGAGILNAVEHAGEGLPMER